MMKFFYTAALTAGLFLAAVDLRSAVRPGTNQEFRVGVILPLSGPAAEYGKSIRNALQLARSENPALFEHIDFKIEDVGYDTKRAVGAFQKLVDIDKVDLIYTFGVSFCQALAPLAESRKKALVGQCVDESSSAGRRYVMRFMNSSDQYMEKLSEHIKQQGFRKPVIIVSDNSYLDLMLESFNRHWGERLERERVPAGEMDLRPFIARLKARRPEIVGVFLGAGQISQFYRQAREVSLEVPTFGTNFFESQHEIKEAGGAMDGAIFVNNVVKEEFHKRYLERFGSESHLAFAGPSYEFALTLASTFVDGKSAGAEEIIGKLLSRAGNAGTAAGPYEPRSSDQAGHYVSFPLSVKRVHGATFELVP